MKESQTDKLYDLLKSGKPVRTDTILELVYGASHLGIARISARIADCKKKYGVEILGQKDKEKPTLYWYWIKREPEQQQLI